MIVRRRVLNVTYSQNWIFEMIIKVTKFHMSNSKVTLHEKQLVLEHVMSLYFSKRQAFTCFF